MEIDYLSNNICKFTPLFNINYNKKQNIISTCFFKLSKSYKKFDLYTNGLVIIYNNILTNYTDYKLRLFIDELIYNDIEIMNILKSLTEIELVLYSYSDKYKSTNIGLLGTMIRFFPMFNFPNNDANIVLITDLDSENPNVNSENPNVNSKNPNVNYTSYIESIKILKILKNNNINLNDIYLLKYGNMLRNISCNFKILYKNTLNIYANAQRIINIKKIDNTVIINFINKVFLNKKIYTYFVFNNTKVYETKIENFRPFVYGIDEYFINNTLTKYLIKNKLGLVINYRYNIFDYIFYINLRLSKIYTLTEKEINLLNNILNIIGKKYKILNFNKLKTIDKINNLDKLIYNIDNIKLYKILYYTFLKYKKYKEYRFIFQKGYSKFININKFNKYFIYQLNKINFINLKYNDIVVDIKKIKKNKL
jgi:hypothetical protein